MSDLDDPGIPGTTAVEADGAVIPHAGLRYSLHRFLVLLAVGALLYAVGLRGLWLLVVSCLLAGGILGIAVLVAGLLYLRGA